MTPSTLYMTSHNEKDRGKKSIYTHTQICIYKTESLCCRAEINMKNRLYRNKNFFLLSYIKMLIE